MRIRSTFIAFFLIFFSSVNSISQDFQEKLYTSYLKSEMGVWNSVLNDLDLLYKKTNDNETLLNIVHTQYGLIAYLIGDKQYSQSKKLIEKAEDNIEKLLAVNYKKVEVLSFKAAIIAYKIAINPYKAIFLGQESNDLLNQALRLDSNNPIALIEKGNAKHYAPSFVGGNPTEAIEYYKKAIHNIETKSSGKPVRVWWYLNALTQLALTAEKAKKPEVAKNTYLKILQIAPDFKWVKDELYPKFKKTYKVK